MEESAGYNVGSNRRAAELAGCALNLSLAASILLVFSLTIAFAGYLQAAPPETTLQYSQTPQTIPTVEQLPPAPLPSQFQSPTGLSLDMALARTLSSNPDLVSTRQNLRVSAEAMAVARQFPTALNPTVSVLSQPWVYVRGTNGEDQLLPLVAVTWSQPLEFGHRTDQRIAIAHAEYHQSYWNVVQTELLALVQTYRAYEATVYRRDKLQIAGDLASFNEGLIQVLRRQWEANQVSAADMTLAEVENQATAQRRETARQDYADALAALRQQMGVLELAEGAEPDGKLEIPGLVGPDDEETLVQTALASRPEIQTAQAQVDRSRAALCLAQADRIPIPSVGPSYERDQSGVSFYGLAVSTPVPLFNSGATLVAQREAEYHRDAVALEQTRQRISVQVKTAAARWKQAQQLVSRTTTLLAPVKDQVARMQRLYEAGQADLVKLFQVRQRWIEVANTQVDATWQAIQAYADLLAALGGASLLSSLPPTNP
jgi:cobalt-zinc-cadmium efflux system outer membrane protein